MRTEEEILIEFRNNNYHIIKNNKNWLHLINSRKGNTILISKNDCSYCFSHFNPISIQEHHLLTELFMCYGWIQTKENTYQYCPHCGTVLEDIKVKVIRG